MSTEPPHFVSPRPNQLFFKHVIRKIFLEDWGLKLTALVITLALWLGVTGLSTPVTKRFTVPLSFSVSNDIEITNTPIQGNIEIEISGDKRKIDNINRTELDALIDISDLSPGDHIVQLTPQNVRVGLPQGVKIDQVLPSSIPVRLETVEERDVEVKPQLTGRPADGFEVYDTAVTPAKVRVRGPSGYIKTLDSIQTEGIDISGARADRAAHQVPVNVSNPKAAVFNTVVEVNVRIGEQRIEKTFNLTTTSGKRVAAVLYGPKTMLSKLRPEELKVETVKNDAGAETPLLTLPSDLQQYVTVQTVRLRP